MVDSVVEELARKRLGRTIKGKWRLDRLLGVGGMAAVYAATHRNGARVAIKMLHATISASQQIRARFVREGYLANKVDHPGVVRVLDDDIDDQDQAAFLVMDLVLGTTLSDRAMERLLNDGEVLDVAEQILQVLSAAHKQGIIHRDLKPDNLLVDNVGKVHVLDFGIARLLDDATNNVSATKTGTAFGTPGFMAPEQALGKQHLITAKTDLYALGATLFALVCGDFVHAAENPQELMILVATQPARSLAGLAPHMAKDVIALIDKSTRNEADKRWESAEVMLAEVRRIRAKLGITSSPVLPIKPDDLTPAPVIVTAPAPAAPKPERMATPPSRVAPPRPVTTKSKLPVSTTGPLTEAAAPTKAPTRIDTSRGMAPVDPPAPSPAPPEATISASEPAPDSADSSLLESEHPPPMIPIRPFGDPESTGQNRTSTPGASFDARRPSPPNGLETPMPTPAPPGRRRMGAVIAIVGSAALLIIIALAMSSGRGASSSTGSEAPSDPTTTAPTIAKSGAPLTPTAKTASASSTAQAIATIPSGVGTASAATTAVVKATATAMTTTTATTAPTATGTAPTGKPTTKPSTKKPIDVGY